MVLVIQVLKSIKESLRDTVFLIEVNRALDGNIAYCVAVGEILGDNAAARLLFLGDLIAITLMLMRWVVLD